MTSTNPSKSFQIQNAYAYVYDAKCVFQHYEKLKVASAVDFDEALENFDVLYKQGLASSTYTPSQLSRGTVIFNKITQGAGYAPAGAMIARQALAGPTRF